MKTSIKLTLVALAIAITATACDPAKKPIPDSDSTKTDSLKKDITAAPVDTTKKDPVKK